MYQSFFLLPPCIHTQLLTTSMATFSSYLMFILITQLHEICPFCLVSAILTFAMATLTWSRQIVPSATKAAVGTLCKHVCIYVRLPVVYLHHHHDNDCHLLTSCMYIYDRFIKQVQFLSRDCSPLELICTAVLEYLSLPRFVCTYVCTRGREGYLCLIDRSLCNCA